MCACFSWCHSAKARILVKFSSVLLFASTVIYVRCLQLCFPANAPTKRRFTAQMQSVNTVLLILVCTHCEIEFKFDRERDSPQKHHFVANKLINTAKIIVAYFMMRSVVVCMCAVRWRISVNMSKACMYIAHCTHEIGLLLSLPEWTFCEHTIWFDYSEVVLDLQNRRPMQINSFLLQSHWTPSFDRKSVLYWAIAESLFILTEKLNWW